ncbi:hypothetical protein EVAR_11547_1 [Eumeta japonica]|uniref:Uncharacterized protein n=1 Tax=Eumeta variegata TaxID=151549 RepID=A0A4C1TZI3_EUMVA|nr:hypothetical protein EVAR_11547_1 [Eumeta japonica]
MTPSSLSDAPDSCLGRRARPAGGSLNSVSDPDLGPIQNMHRGGCVGRAAAATSASAMQAPAARPPYIAGPGGPRGSGPFNDDRSH